MYGNNSNDATNKVKNDVKDEYVRKNGILKKLIKNIQVILFMKQMRIG